MVDFRNHVGPVLQAGAAGDAVVAAIKALNPRVHVADRGSYVRVMVPERCTVTRSAIEAHLGRPFRFPADLEQIMPSFKGRLSIGDDEVSWALAVPEGERS